MKLLFLAYRNLILQRSRYFLMAMGVSIGFMAITVLTALSSGILRTMYDKACRYFPGEVSILDRRIDSRFFVNTEEITQKIYNSHLGIKTVTSRTIDYDSDFPIYCNGRKAAVRRIIGVDFDTEMESFKNMPIVAGNLQDFLGEEGENGIILSSAVAEFLDAKIGDNITILAGIDDLYTGDGFEKIRPAIQNTGTYTLKAIFHEQNFFAYACYLHRRDLNTLMSYPEGAANEIAVYFNDSQSIKRNTVKLHNFLIKNGYDNTKLCLTREDYDGSWGDYDFVVYSLETVLGNIKDLIFVFNICTYFVLAVFLAIMIIGILNTYKVLVYERTREIGTMRAMGMQKIHVGNLFVNEALLLALFSCILGFILALVTLRIITGLNFSHINLINFFTINGHLRYWILPGQVMVNLILVASAVIVAAIQPIINACKITPGEALRTD